MDCLARFVRFGLGTTWVFHRRALDPDFHTGECMAIETDCQEPGRTLSGRAGQRRAEPTDPQSRMPGIRWRVMNRRPFPTPRSPHSCLTEEHDETGDDPGLKAVYDELWAKPNLGATFATAIRQAIDEVIDGPRIGRFRFSDLEKTEKT